MQSSDTRASSEDLDSIHDIHSFSLEESSPDGNADAEKSLLWNARTKSYRRDFLWGPLSTKALIFGTLLNLVLFLTSISILSSSRGAKILSNQDYWRATAYYSPVFDRFNIPKVTRLTNGSFWDTDPPSIWRKRTGAEADRAWESIGSGISPIIITSADVVALGKDPRKAVKVPAELNVGDDAYIAGMDVFHHIHCLDKLRREISYSHYHEATEGPSPGSELHEAHINHCLDVLTQALRCTASVDMVTFNWVEGHRMPQPDFNNKKVCRDFEALRRWTIENGVDTDAFFKAADKPPADAVIIPEYRPHHRGE